MPKESVTGLTCQKVTNNAKNSTKRQSQVKATSSLPTKTKATEVRNKKRHRPNSMEDESFSEKPASEDDTKRQRKMDSDVESRRQQFYDKTDWKPIDDQMFPTPLKDDSENKAIDVIPSSSVMMSPGCPRSTRPGVLQEINTSSTLPKCHYQFRNILTHHSHCRASPLPMLSWADSDELWHSMVDKESVYKRNSGYLSRHEQLDPRMRSILLDWLIEVTEVYNLHRETFYLCVDYIDRYLSNTTNIHKTRLQLVGVTALFIAAKLEEIYPPKLVDFSYVTDGACSENEILSQELLMLSTLKWSLAPVTAVSWLNVYLQTAHAAYAPGPAPSTAFFLPQYPQETFVHIAQLLDLCTLDIQSLDFSSGVLAASALYHFSSRELAIQVSGYQFKDIVNCVHWMAPFAITVRDTGLQPLKKFHRTQPSEYHNIQTHANDIDVLDRVFQNRSKIHTQLTCQSPVEMGCFMTPPKSGQKPAVTSPPASSQIC